MKQLSGYLRSALYNIRHNKAYAAFCILGTALTFVFITIILQLYYSVSQDTAPGVNASRTIHISSFEDPSGQYLGGIPPEEIRGFSRHIRDIETYGSSDDQYGNIILETGRVISATATFVNDGYWQVNQFDFTQGRAFTPDDYNARAQTAVIKKNIAESYFGRENAIGKKLTFEGTEYTIIGIVDDFSAVATKNLSTIWLPDHFDKFAANKRGFYDLYLMFPATLPAEQMKQAVFDAVQFHFKTKGQETSLSIDNIRTEREQRLKSFGNKLLSYGVGVVLLILLIIPAINIVSLSVANMQNRALEIAIRRSVGASILSSFIQIIIENLLLVLIGTILGILLTFPIVSLIEKSLLNISFVGEMSLISGLSLPVLILYILPLSLIFTLLSGGIPAFVASRNNISQALKGGSK